MSGGDPLRAVKPTASVGRHARCALVGSLLAIGSHFSLDAIGAEPPVVAKPAPPAPFTVETLAGRVVWLHEALRQSRQIQSVAEAADRVLAIQTADGRLVPLVEDVRGRAFRRDERLRNVPLELLVRRYPETSFAQVIGVFGQEKGKRVEIDYWCEVCAIAMYELKDCECCQGPIELRKRLAPK